MARDYANKKVASPQRKIPRVLLVVFAVFCLLGALGIYALHYHQERVHNWLKGAKTLVSHKESVLAAAVPEDEVQFNFYNELPNMRVNLPTAAQSNQAKPFSIIVRKSTEQTLRSIDLSTKIDESIQSALTEQAPSKPAAQFIVQINEFDNQLPASQLRLSLLLAGIETDVVKTAEGKFRVQKGPFTNEREAKAVLRKLNLKGYDATVIKT